MPPQVDYGLMATVAAGGLLVNVAGAWILGAAPARAERPRGLPARAGRPAGLDRRADRGRPDRAVRLVLGRPGGQRRDRPHHRRQRRAAASSTSINVLMEGVPSHLKTDEVRGAVWTTRRGSATSTICTCGALGGETPLLTAHLVLDHSVAGRDQVLREATRALRERFGITHCTLQIEPPDYNIVQDLTVPTRRGDGLGDPRSEPSGRSENQSRT